MGMVQLNASDHSSFKHVVSEALLNLPAITEAGWTGYGVMAQGFAAIFIKPNSTVESFNETFAPFYNLSKQPGIEGSVGAYQSTWNGYRDTFLRDPNIGTNVQDTSRLLTAEVAQHNTDELVDFIVENSPSTGFNFIGRVNNDERDNTAIHDIWKYSIGLLTVSVDWADNATESVKHQKRLQAVNFSHRLTEIVGSNGGTYINEANP